MRPTTKFADLPGFDLSGYTIKTQEDDLRGARSTSATITLYEAQAKSPRYVIEKRAWESHQQETRREAELLYANRHIPEIVELYGTSGLAGLVEEALIKETGWEILSTSFLTQVNELTNLRILKAFCGAMRNFWTNGLDEYVEIYPQSFFVNNAEGNVRIKAIDLGTSLPPELIQNRKVGSFFAMVTYFLTSGRGKTYRDAMLVRNIEGHILERAKRSVKPEYHPLLAAAASYDNVGAVSGELDKILMRKS